MEKTKKCNIAINSASTFLYDVIAVEQQRGQLQLLLL
jgi:hypothetical protein